ncbi:flagellar hook capping protein [Novosphingobium sp. Rr 2-17]|uniref:flagellar hook assembly protein FlgD n=1 Tax=Novosphingobium sp. Rr 2-17 TaxID=555793 RepID=UPI000269953E|nr:flagellar hook capping FlgD N-terminal domain-containing protein [Novosphingobium sp. Rr 2-17]EIZ78729.1 flagellar hook capping protein [Novosphingobium sp. Rr 2-17]
MSILPVTTTAASQPISTSAAAAPKAAMGADFNMFLKLLTTQMQNQDPLSPMDSTQYTQQLAQYSQVEQTVQQTGTLKDILARLSTQDMSQAAGFIGREAVFNSSVSGLGATPASWNYSAGGAISRATATITDASGAQVFTGPIDLSGTDGTYRWDGTLADGSKAPSGAYTLAIKAVDASGAAVATTVSSVGTVNDVSLKNGVVSLGVNGVAMAMDTLVRLAVAK